ncbi:hypothetical protein G9C98_000609 [Cotesia typhae]|uniref:cGMP-dependent protein kinase interacting domain-containing protein n=1 Tax=Cotesia typhae TaxID=2053667 RepID=A0A8J5R5C0_9HYME|nr:hypothetical protein G9C98_000609 [Cotesia typhae]
MSTYRKRAQAKPTTAAGLRAQASANGSSIFRNRPRSITGLFGSNQSSFSNLLGINTSNYNSPSHNINKSSKSFYKNPYTNSINNLNYPTSYTTYGGTASGYGSLTLPSHSAVSSLNLAVPSTSYNYNRNSTGSSITAVSKNNSSVNSTKKSSDNYNRRVKKAESFNRPKASKASGIGSRSSSLQSLAGSEGYASGNERSGRSSRIGSITSLSSDISVTPSSRIKSSNSENGELDYKKLWEESQAENERLKEKLRRSDEQLKEARSSLEKVQSTQSKLSLSEAEKRERRAMERKLSEMEEELKQLQKLKAENERLKAENRALTRVVSKLTNTTK